MNDAIIISDTHLGSDVCEVKSLETFIDSYVWNNTKKLIINGDFFDNLDFRRLKKSHWNILSLLRRMSKHKEIIWIRGNHDGDAEIISHLIGVDFKDEYTFTSGDKNVLCIHGDQFDDFIYKYPATTKVADLLYRTVQKFDKRFLPQFIKQRSKIYLRCNENMINSSTKYARGKEADVVCLGHTHYATVDKKHDVDYYNSGCWTEKRSSYLTVNDGVVQLEYWD